MKVDGLEDCVRRRLRQAREDHEPGAGGLCSGGDFCCCVDIGYALESLLEEAGLTPEPHEVTDDDE